MDKNAISTNNAPQAIGPYSQAIVMNCVCYVSGQIPINPKDGSMADNIKDQTKQCLENLSAILQSDGYSLDDALKVTVYMTDLSLFNEMNEVYAEYFTYEPPARSTVGVKELPKGALIEIDLIASKQ